MSLGQILGVPVRMYDSDFSEPLGPRVRRSLSKKLSPRLRIRKFALEEILDLTAGFYGSGFLYSPEGSSVIASLNKEL